VEVQMSIKRKVVVDDELFGLHEQLACERREKEELRTKLQECVDTILKLEKSRDELGKMLNDQLSLTFHVPKLIELFFKFGKEPHAIEKFWCQFGQMMASQEQLDRKQNVSNCAVKVKWDKSSIKVLLKDEKDATKT
jgi:hypothetical protein